MKILIDTDIGDDIDDALALLLAMELNMPIIGLTTVFLNTDIRARICKKLLKLYGEGYERVPVYAGTSSPEADFSTALCQRTADLVKDEFSPDNKEDFGAVDFIIESAKRYGKELTLLAIGPFTNVCAAIKKDAEAMASVGRIVIMGGAYYRQYADWNVSCDPYSADVMFGSLSNIECIGADVTHALGRISAELSDLMESRASEDSARGYVSELYRLWRKSTGGKIAMLHDPLVVYYLTDPNCLEMKPAQVAVITEGVGRGITLNLGEYTKAYMNPVLKDAQINRQLVAASVLNRDIFGKIEEIYH